MTPSPTLCLALCQSGFVCLSLCLSFPSLDPFSLSPPLPVSLCSGNPPSFKIYHYNLAYPQDLPFCHNLPIIICRICITESHREVKTSTDTNCTNRQRSKSDVKYNLFIHLYIHVKGQ